jgi:hypothetical protein
MFVGTRWKLEGGMLGTRPFFCSLAPTDMATILSFGKLRPREVNQVFSLGWLRSEGKREWVTTVRMSRALCGPMLVRKDALYVGLKPTGPVN